MTGLYSRGTDGSRRGAGNPGRGTGFCGYETSAPRLLPGQGNPRAPAMGLYENGVIRDKPSTAPIITMSDPPNITRSIMLADMLEIMGTLQKGLVDLGFIGGAQVDRFGNLNTTWVNSGADGCTRLPGSGGGADIAPLSRRLLIIMAHEKRRFVERVDYITSPGYGSGGDWRQEVGLIGAVPTRSLPPWVSSDSIRKPGKPTWIPSIPAWTWKT